MFFADNLKEETHSKYLFVSVDKYFLLNTLSVGRLEGYVISLVTFCDVTKFVNIFSCDGLDNFLNHRCWSAVNWILRF